MLPQGHSLWKFSRYVTAFLTYAFFRRCTVIANSIHVDGEGYIHERNASQVGQVLTAAYH